MALTKVLSRTALVQAVPRKVVLSGSSNGSPATSRALTSVLAESYYNQEQKELQATTKKLIETEINPVSNLSLCKVYDPNKSSCHLQAFKFEYRLPGLPVLSRQHGDKWEKEKMYPAHEVMKKMGNAGLLGINKPVEYGGLGIDYKYQERGYCSLVGMN